MMKRVLLAALAVLWCGTAAASCDATIPGPGGASTTLDCTIPSLVSWGVLDVTTSSAPINVGLVAGPNIPLGFPLPGKPLPSRGLDLLNRGPGLVYFCPFGGECNEAHGQIIGYGWSRTFAIGASHVVPTIVSPSTARVEIKW